jgi:MYXO-CTERM domain-containing protein
VPRDVHTAPTDARWWWLAVLLTLGVEWLMRRRRRETRA